MVEGDKHDNTSSSASVREQGNVSLQCPKLTEINYTTWALLMETILKAYGIWETIVAKEGEATNEKKENTSKAMIFQTLPQDVLMQVAQYSTAKEVWDSIKVKYLGADLVQKARLQTLRSELETLRMKPNEKVSDYGGKLSSIMAKFKGLGETLEDKISFPITAAFAEPAFGVQGVIPPSAIGRQPPCDPMSDVGVSGGSAALHTHFQDTMNVIHPHIPSNSRAASGSQQLSTPVPDEVLLLVTRIQVHKSVRQAHRTAREKFEDTNIPNFKVRLYNVIGAREYELPTGDMLGAIVYEAGPEANMDYDIVLEERSGHPQRVHKLHPSYRSLQFPFLFLYGEDGYKKEMKMVGSNGSSSQQKRLNMLAYYSYYLHDHANLYNYLSRTRRLFQQYVVTAFCMVEQNRIDFIREHQNDIRNEYLLGIYDAINRGDNNGSDCGSRLILPQSFTSGPRYMYSHYLDALIYWGENSVLQTREKFEDTNIPNFKVRLYNVAVHQEYELPTGDMLGAIVYEAGPEANMDYDIVLEERSGHPQRIHKLHPSYRSLQFPFLFLYGEDGYKKEMKMNRIDFIREHQNDIRNEYLSGIYDAINRGDNNGSDCGSRLILPQSFTGGPRYMYSHYLDALTVCRVHGNPSCFITFTYNVKWPKITDYMAQFLLLTTTDRADVVDRVFEMKIHLFVAYLRDSQPFGKVIAVLYTVEFQKRCLPHCHTLLWIDELFRIVGMEDTL
ncbi:DNA helicase [Tanacetum coccineum]